MKHPRILAQIETLRWAITPEALESIWEIVSQDLTVDTIDAYMRFHSLSEGAREAIVSGLGSPAFDNGLSFRKGDMGAIRIDGPIIPRADSFSRMSGMVSIDDLMSDFKAFEADPGIKRILLLFDSPGGAITGITEFSSLIYASQKQTIGYVYGRAASAAYLMLSATDVAIANDMSEVGSIGIVATYRASKDDNKVEIVSAQSPDKRPDLSTTEGQANIQQVVNELTDVIVDTVATNRRVSAETVLADFGKGGTVAAMRAQSVGMIDRVATLESVLNEPFKPAAITMSAQNTNQPATAGTTGGQRMLKSLKEFLAENPAAAAEYENSIKAARDEGHKTGVDEVNERTAKAAKFMASDSYGEAINKLAMRVITGDVDQSALEAAVAVCDEMKEKKESKAAKDATEETGSTTGGGNLGPTGRAAELEQANRVRKARGQKPLSLEA